MDRQTIKILCLGDSLTAGFIKGNLFSPYSDHLSTLFRDSSSNQSSAIDVVFINAGVNGDTTRDIQARLPSLLQLHQFHYAVVLAGTNDLGGIFDDSTMTTEKQIAHISYDTITNLLTAAPTLRSFLHLTIPYTLFDRLDLSDKSRKDALNKRIMNDPCPKKRVLDLNDPILGFNYLLMSEEDREDCWQDALHYSESGYKRLAHIIYKELAEMLHFE